MRRPRAISTALWAALAAAVWSLFGAPVALASGEGLLGAPSDLTITFFGFGVMIFFTTTVIVLSYVQHRLETRRERARAELERLSER